MSNGKESWGPQRPMRVSMNCTTEPVLWKNMKSNMLPVLSFIKVIQAREIGLHGTLFLQLPLWMELGVRHLHPSQLMRPQEDAATSARSWDTLDGIAHGGKNVVGVKSGLGAEDLSEAELERLLAEKRLSREQSMANEVENSHANTVTASDSCARAVGSAL